MARYIDADKIGWRITFDSKGNKVKYVTRGDIKAISTADVQPVVHGHWIEDNERTKSYVFFCSCCKGKAYSNVSGSAKYHVKKCTLTYCPNCGARMDGEGE